MAKQVINIGTTANDGTGDPLRDAFDKVNDNFTELYSDDAGDVGSIIAGSGIYVDQATGDVTVTNLDPNATHTGDVTGSTALTIANDVVDHDNLDGRYTAVQDISTTSGTINLDASSYAAFNLTGNLTTATLNVQNIKTGQAIDILLSGTLTSAVLTLADDFTTSAINKVGSNDLDTTGTNLIQLLCVDDTDSDAILTWAVATYTTDTSA